MAPVPGNEVAKDGSSKTAKKFAVFLRSNKMSLMALSCRATSREAWLLYPRKLPRLSPINAAAKGQQPTSRFGS
jgi:hypothetical protein